MRQNPILNLFIMSFLNFGDLFVAKNKKKVTYRKEFISN